MDRALRTTFDEVAELYDRARPAYPGELFDDLVDVARLGEGARVLELGSGTGIATLPLAERGFELVCVELGAHLAAVARRKLAAFPNVEVVNASFESWTPPGRFDAVVAFASFHWLDPAVRYERCADALRPGGALAVVRPNHVLPSDGDEFFREVQADYRVGRARRPEDARRGAGARRSRPATTRAELAASGLFGDVVVRRRQWDVTYDADAYVAVLDTYSWNRALAEAGPPAAVRADPAADRGSARRHGAEDVPRDAHGRAPALSSSRLPNGSSTKSRSTPAIFASSSNSTPAPARRARSAPRSSTTKPGCAFRAGANGSSTPRWSSCAPTRNHAPPRARIGSGFGISSRPSTPP